MLCNQLLTVGLKEEHSYLTIARACDNLILTGVQIAPLILFFLGGGQRGGGKLKEEGKGG